MAGRRSKGRPILGAISGLLFGVFLSVALSVYASVPADSILYYILTILGLLVSASCWASPDRCGAARADRHPSRAADGYRARCQGDTLFMAAS
jgi:hypothetical protein